MYYFTRAETVDEGDALDSYKHNALAHGINSRLRSCLGDGPWRIAWFFYSAFRQFCYGENYQTTLANLYPADSFFRWWQHISPDQHVPTAAPGEVGGMNYNNPISQYIVGNAAGMLPEDVRAQQVPPAFTTDTATQKWAKFKSQRGFIRDGESVNLQYAHFLWFVAYLPADYNPDRNQFHADSGYGSWPNPDGNGPVLSKSSAQSVRRAGAAFTREFRGSDAQRNADKYHVQDAANWTEAMTRTLYVAPQWTTASGTNGQYPQWKATGETFPAGTAIPLVDPAGPSYDMHVNFVGTHIWAKATGLVGSTLLSIKHAGGEFTLPINDDTGAIYQWPTEERFTSITMEFGADATFSDATGTIEIETTEIYDIKPETDDLYAIARLSATHDTVPDGRGTLETVSKAIVDDYLLYGGIVNQHDEQNIPDNSEGRANRSAMYEAAREWSKFVRIVPGFTEGNENQFIAMERVKISEDPVKYRQSLWFRRRAMDAPDGVEAKDAFAGVAPIVGEAAAAGWSNEWMMGIQLKPYSLGDVVQWEKEGFPTNQTFLDRALFGHNFESEWRRWIKRHVAAEQVSPIGFSTIATEAPTLFRYAPFPQSGRPDERYDDDYVNQDAVTTDNRRFLKSCRIYEPDLDIEHIEEFADAPLDLYDAADGAYLATEDGTILYTETVDAQVRLDFTQSLHSTRNEADPDAAPQEYPWNFLEGDYEATWEALRKENDNLYRTSENALRGFLFHAWSVYEFGESSGLTRNLDNTVGDHAHTSDIYTGGGGPRFGCTLPHFYFVKLMPLVYADGNTDPEYGTDTRFVHDSMLQAETYLRVMCEGFLRSHNDQPCDTNAELAEFTYAQLMEDASEKVQAGDAWRHFPALPVHETDRVTAEWVRTDGPWGTGPLPYTYHDAYRFNLLVEAVNLLLHVRLPWPADVLPESRVGTGNVDNDLGMTSEHGSVYPELPALTFDTQAPPALSDGEFGPWSEIPGFTWNAYHETRLRHPSYDGPTQTAYAIYASAEQVRFTVNNSDAMKDALPERLKDMVDNNRIGLATHRWEYIDWTEWTSVGTGQGDLGWTFTDGTEYTVDDDNIGPPADQHRDTISEVCAVTVGGAFQPDYPHSDQREYWLGRESVTNHEFDGDAGPQRWITVQVDSGLNMTISPPITDPLPEP